MRVRDDGCPPITEILNRLFAAMHENSFEVLINSQVKLKRFSGLTVSAISNHKLHLS